MATNIRNMIAHTPTPPLMMSLACIGISSDQIIKAIWAAMAIPINVRAEYFKGLCFGDLNKRLM
jgi:hypothetical protein